MKALASQILSTSQVAISLQSIALVTFITAFAIICVRLAGKNAHSKHEELGSKLIRD